MNVRNKQITDRILNEIIFFFHVFVDRNMSDERSDEIKYNVLDFATDRFKLFYFLRKKIKINVC